MSDIPTCTPTYHPSWEEVLGPVLDEHWPQIQSLLDAGPFLPAAENLFRAFWQPRDQVRVLILGQDPYPTPGHPMGLAFSTQPGVKRPKSLVNIYRELHDDLGVEPPSDGDLSAWNDQGVMLLNRVLSVAPGQAGSHRGHGWEAVTEAAIRSLDSEQLVAILWGRDAQKCASFIPHAHKLAAPHPSPLSAHRGFFGSRPFSQANEYLRAAGAREVDWRL